MTKPLHCPFPARVNLHAEQVQRGSLEWAQRFGLVSSSAAVARLERSCVGWLVARALPDARPDALRICADWTTWFCLLDDHVEELGSTAAGEELARLLAGFRDGASAQSDPFARALDDLRVCMTTASSPAWLGHFEALVGDLFANFILESHHREHGRVPDLATYRAMREVTVGSHPEFALAELACGVPLTESERAHPIIARLTAAAARSVGWANDLFTCVREIGAGEVHNLVVVLVTHCDMTPEQAAAEAARIHDAEVREVEALERELHDAGLREDVRRWVECVKSWIRGHLDWATQTGRYGTPGLGLAA